MKRVVSSFGVLGVAALALSTPGCLGGFGEDHEPLRLVINLQADSKVGSIDDPLPIAVDGPDFYEFSVEALDRFGQRAPFDGWLRLSAQPGSVLELSGEGTTGRNIKITNGYAEGLRAGLMRAYGEARFVVRDLGYTPVDPTAEIAPQCSDGIDNDGDGAIDYPADNDCAFANDDSETGGTYAQGVSQAIHYRLPRIAEVRGYTTGGTDTPFKAQTVQIDTGYKQTTREYDFSVVVTRLSSNGFYVADVEDDRAVEDRTGFSGVFMFNFSTPPNMGYCDRVRRLAGTATVFYGSIQLGYPTWSVVRWNPEEGPCLIPEPTWFKVADTFNSSTKLKNVHSLVRVRAGEYERDGKTFRTEVHIGSKLGPNHPERRADGSFNLTADATNCDYNGDLSIDYDNDPEKGCAAACENDVECTEWSNYSTRSNFQLSLIDGEWDGTKYINPSTAKMQANGTTSTTFSAVALRGQSIGSFSGTLGYFSGGSQFTIEARCSDDIVLDPSQAPLPSNEACIIRTDTDTGEAE